MGISENVKLLRERHNLSQTELGKIAGVSAKAVSTWELGIKEPRMGAIQKIAAYFHLEKSNLIEDGGLDRDFSQKDSSATPEGQEVAQNLGIFDYSILSDSYDYSKDPEARLSQIQPDLLKELSLKFDGDPRYIWCMYEAIQRGASSSDIALAALAATIPQNTELQNLFDALNYLGKDMCLTFMRFLATQEQYTQK